MRKRKDETEENKQNTQKSQFKLLKSDALRKKTMRRREKNDHFSGKEKKVRTARKRRRQQFATSN
jgi:hypothetical protein